MKTIDTLKKELHKIQMAQRRCVSEHGFVKPWLRYEYQTLTQKAKEFRNSIKWLEEQGIGV